MLRTLERRLIFLFISFAMLVIVSVAATTWGLDNQRQDAVLINLSGRQRMLAQEMGRLAFEAGAGEFANNAALQDSEQLFNDTLLALKDGGTVLYQPQNIITISATQDTQLRSALDKVEETWREYRNLLNKLQQIDHGDSAFLPTLQTIEAKSSNLVQEADVVVRLFEASSTAKVNRLRFIQISFLVCALGLLVSGAWITRKSVLLPLKQLGQAVTRLGENDLDTALKVDDPEELRALSRSFEAMRIRLRSSRQELIQMNDKLEERVVQRTQELETLNAVSREISSRLNIQQVLNSVTDKARTLLDGEVASLCLVDENKQWLKLQAVSGPQSAVRAQAVLAEEEWTDSVLKSDQAMMCGVGACSGGCRMLTDPYRASQLAAPLRIGERVIGALCVGSPTQNHFPVEATGMLTKLANVAAIALENARLYAQAERVATLEERHRVAAEMHDGLGQTLSYLGLMTDQVVIFLADGKDDDAIEHLQKTRRTIQVATTEVRRAIDNLMNETPSIFNLSTSLEKALNEFSAENNLPITYQIETDFSPNCPRKVSQQVLNITREALANIARHAQAKQVSVETGSTGNLFYVTIQDDGRGFDSSQPGPGGHFGLQIMRSRAALIGGKTEIESAEGCGTRVTLTWPMETKE